MRLAGRAVAAACLSLAAASLASCGSSPNRVTTTESTPTFATAPYTPQQQRVERGAKLVITDGCSACHLNGGAGARAPSFTSLAGHRVRLRNGRTALVDEQLLTKSLLHPNAYELSGYDPAPMLAALRRLHLSERPADVAALVAFIEQVGPETE